MKELVTPKPIPLVLLEIGIGVEMTLIDNIIHASKFFLTPYIVLKDTPVTERPNFQSIHLAELVDTTSEHVDDLAASVKHVVVGD